MAQTIFFCNKNTHVATIKKSPPDSKGGFCLWCMICKNQINVLCRTYLLTSFPLPKIVAPKSQMPAMPTEPYTTRVKVVILPSKYPTMSNEKTPTSNQLRAPTMTSINARIVKKFFISTSCVYCLQQAKNYARSIKR